MKRTGSLISIVVVIAMMLAMLAGCGQATPSVAPSAAPATTAAAASAAAEATTAASAVDSWTVDTTPRTVEWYVATSDYNSSFDPNAMFAAKVLKEKTGITINFTFPVGGDQDEKLNTMIASDSLPDMIAVGENSQQYPMLEQGGKLQPLNKLMDASAPAFKKLLTKSMVDWCTYSDGNLYGIPSGFISKEEITPDSTYKYTTSTGIIARKDIMDQLGIVPNDFKTADGAIKALEKVRDAKVMYNGKKVIPLYIGYDVVDDADWNIRDLFSVPYENPDGTLANKFHSTQYLDMMQWLSKCYNDGLMSQENFTGTYDTETANLASGQIFCMAGCLGDFGDGISGLLANDKNATWEGVGPIGPADGSPMYAKTGSMTGWLMTCIPLTTKQPERVLALMNYIYTDEGRYLFIVGVEGQTFTLQDGKAVLNPDIQAEFTADQKKAFAKWGFSGKTTNEGVMWMMFDRVWGQNHAPVSTAPMDVLWQNLNDFARQNCVPAAPFEAINPDPGSPEADIQAQVDNIRNEEMAKIILCKTPEEVTAAWNAYVAKVDALGYDKVIAAKNVKFQKNKKALGIQFAWPTNGK